MRLSLDWIGDYVTLPADLTPKRLAHDLTLSTVEVERVEDLADALQHVVVAEVRASAPHPTSDRLQVVEVDDGEGGCTVVCGGRNVAPGMRVALARPGARCRDANGDLVQIEISTVRGQRSEGMLCAASELGLGLLLPCNEGEIIDLHDVDAVPGTALSTAIGYDDVVLEIDNKSLTNRPDLWGHYGMARELAALYGCPLRSLPRFQPPTERGGLTVDIADEERCFRYTATQILGVRVVPSPLWMRSRLARVGVRSINLPVDLTNYVMMAVGQPSHAFDARDLPTRVEIRRARDREPLTLLDGTSLELESETLVIANHEVALALAGVMGGDASVRPGTDALWLEVASFDAVEVRRAARRHGVRTESSMRFEKGIDPDRVDDALGLFVDLLRREQPDAVIASHVDCFPRPLPRVSIDVEVEFLHRRLGCPLPEEEMQASLERLGFGVRRNAGRFALTVPPWRATGDVSLPEDIVEEIARLHGYEALGFSPPIVALRAPAIQPRRRMERRLKEALATRAGMREIVTYPWVSRGLLEACGMGEMPTLGLAHPPTPGLRLAPSLVPQLLATVASNLRFLDAFAIFEQNRVFATELEATSSARERLPHQPRKLAAAFVGRDAAEQFHRAKGVLERLPRVVQFEPYRFDRDADAPWGDPAACLGIAVGSRPIGVLAVVSARTKRKVGIRGAEIAVFELEVDQLSPFASRSNHVVDVPSVPQVDFDINVMVDRKVEWARIHDVAAGAESLVRDVSFVDEYIGQQIADGRKSVTLRLRLGVDDGTLSREQIDEAATRVMAALEQQLGAVIRR